MNKESQGSFLGGHFCQLFCLGCQPKSIMRVCEFACSVTVHDVLQFVEVTASEAASVRFGCSEYALGYSKFKQVRVWIFG